MSEYNYDDYLELLNSMEKNDAIDVSISDLINSVYLIEQQTEGMAILLQLNKLDSEQLNHIIKRLRDGSSDLRTMLSALRQFNRME